MLISCVPTGTIGPTIKLVPGKSTNIGNNVAVIWLTATEPVLFIESFISGSWPIAEELSVELNVPAKLAISET